MIGHFLDNNRVLASHADGKIHRFHRHTNLGAQTGRDKTILLINNFYLFHESPCSCYKGTETFQERNHNFIKNTEKGFCAKSIPLHSFYPTSKNQMPKQMFEEDNGASELLRIIDLLNAAMGDVKKTKTVEELQTVINNINRVINEVKKSLASQGKIT